MKEMSKRLDLSPIVALETWSITKRAYDSEDVFAGVQGIVLKRRRMAPVKIMMPARMEVSPEGHLRDPSQVRHEEPK